MSKRVTLSDDDLIVLHYMLDNVTHGSFHSEKTSVMLSKQRIKQLKEKL